MNSMNIWKKKQEKKTVEMIYEQANISTNQSDEIYVAIAMAIYGASEYHDEENAILTIKKTASIYSPWSSKIYTLRELPLRK